MTWRYPPHRQGGIVSDVQPLKAAAMAAAAAVQPSPLRLLANALSVEQEISEILATEAGIPAAA